VNVGKHEASRVAERARNDADAAELAKFGELAARWWDPAGPMRPLHLMNPVRLDYILRHGAGVLGVDRDRPRPLAGLRALDVGCGAGLLTEPLARLGAEVLGLDAAPEMIEIARAHAAEAGLEIAYEVGTSDDAVAADRRFDLVLAMEVIEHVADLPLFLAAAAGLVRPGGAFAAATINRTPKSFLFAIVGAEYVLGWLPAGTHDWRKLVRPSELVPPLRRAGLRMDALCGLAFDPFRRAWRLAPRDLDVNYMAFAVRPG
jgi:2-polyprenyl-6-hydroxyphenyl methylase / 3-demethylubiquinone-9 3-methyltransferase